MTAPLKILMIEDDLRNQQSARDTIVGHDLTVVDRRDEALYSYLTGGGKKFDVLILGPKLTGYEGMDWKWFEVMVAAFATPFVGVFTDSEHHYDPLSRVHEYNKGARIMTFDVGENCVGEGQWPTLVKDWTKVLAELLSQKA